MSWDSRVNRHLALFSGYTLLMSRVVKPGPDGKLEFLDKVLLGMWAIWSIGIGVIGLGVGGFIIYVILTG